MREDRNTVGVTWAVLVFLVVFCFSLFVVDQNARSIVREEVLRCLRAPDAESAAMACPQWMQEARR